MLVPVKNWNPSTSRSVIPLSGISTKDASFYHRDTYSTMFIISLLMIARKCKQLDVSQQQEDNDNVVHLHNGVLLSCNNNKKIGIMKFAGEWTELEKILSCIRKWWVYKGPYAHRSLGKPEILNTQKPLLHERDKISSFPP